MKKRNLLLTAALTVLSLGNLTVNAVAPKTTNDTLDATTCKDGVVYTNYYYLADAIWKGETDIQNASGKIMSIAAKTTEGSYTDFIPTGISTVIGSKNIYTANNINKVAGVVNIIKDEEGNSDYINRVTLSDFWRNFNRFYDDPLKGNTSSDGKKITTMNVAHQWAKFDFSSNQWSELSDSHVSTNSVDVSILKKASIKLTNVDINYQNDSTPTSARIKIARAYNEGAEFYYTDHAPITYETHNIYFQPQLYYVQYCVKAENENSKALTYNKNTTDNVSNMPNSQTYDKAEITLDPKTPARTGYKFLGWATTTNNPSKLYQPASKYSEAALVLYAQWEKEGENKTATKFTITYDANKGINAPAPDTSDTVKCTKIAEAGKMTRDGYKFVGWSTNKDAKEADSKYAPGKDYCEGKDITLYAIWTVGSSENPDTGVSAHLVAFGIAAIAAGAALVVARKKGLFEQI